jgi:hypothetical protein
MSSWSESAWCERALAPYHLQPGTIREFLSFSPLWWSSLVVIGFFDSDRKLSYAF